MISPMVAAVDNHVAERLWEEPTREPAASAALPGDRARRSTQRSQGTAALGVRVAQGSSTRR